MNTNSHTSAHSIAPSKTITNKDKLNISSLLIDFEIYQKVSSNVDYIGIDPLNSRLFVQFKGGTGSYFYNEIPYEHLSALLNAESVGRYISSNIVNKFRVEKHPERLIEPLQA